MSDVSSNMNSDSQNSWARPLFLCVLIAATVAVRVVPHPWNFAPVGAVALFAGATFGQRWAAFLVPLLAMFLADVLLAMSEGYDVVTPTTALIYGCYALYVVLGFWLRSRWRQGVPVAGAALLGAVVFFLVTNAAAWWGMSTGADARYTPDFSGLMASYAAGVPFFGNTLLGDAVFCTLLFGGLALAEHYIPALKPESQTQPMTA